METKKQLKLGNILLNAGKINQAHLQEAMEKQQIFKRKIGEILIMMGLLNPEELDLYLFFQRQFQHPEIHDFKIDAELLKRVSVEGLFSGRDN